MQSVEPSERQVAVDRYFDRNASYWREIYGEESVEAAIYRTRQEAALAWVDEFGLGAGASALDVGCGAGFVALELAGRGMRIDAIDSSPAMVEQARGHVRQAGVDDRVSAAVGDVHSLGAADSSYGLVFALGVLPWLHAPDVALAEIARVLEPGGYLIATADNAVRLTNLLDPRLHPLLLPFKRAFRRVRPRRDGFGPHSYALGRTVDRMLARAGLVKIASRTVGFGPFTLLARPVLPRTVGLAVNRRLQWLAERNVPGLRAAGAHYLVLARKP
jgi:ubiquinone/menaquinone biosynthesis C-methylase UbiE